MSGLQEFFDKICEELDIKTSLWSVFGFKYRKTNVHLLCEILSKIKEIKNQTRLIAPIFIDSKELETMIRKIAHEEATKHDIF